jgi:hypothetical protein
MALIKTGDALTTAKYQPGASVSNDGYNLLTSTVVWTGDTAGTPPKKGDAHPVFAFMKAWKIQNEYRSTSLINYKVEYVGVCKSDAATGLWVSHTETIANMSGAVSLSTEKIQSHPNFFDATVPVGGSEDDFMIAGHGTGTASVPVYPASTLVNGEFVGLNGAHFKKPEKGGTTYEFTGFKDPNATYRAYYGKSNYLAPTTGLSGIIYTTQSAVVQKFVSNVGRSSLVQGWEGGPKLIPDFIGTNFEGAFGGQVLLAGVNFEEYGHVYKCSYQIRINKEGYPRAVYPLFV